MKSIFKKTIYACIIGTLLTSCYKDDTKPTDFRDKYIGKYQVSENISCYGPCGTCSSLKDTVIIVDYGITDSTLSILGRDVYLDSTEHYHNYHYSLRLWNDSIYSDFMNGGLGCGKKETYNGLKISNNPL